MTNKNIDTQLHYDKETKNTIRYTEKNPDKPLTIYLPKSKVEDMGNPNVITLTITPYEE